MARNLCLAPLRLGILRAAAVGNGEDAQCRIGPQDESVTVTFLCEARADGMVILDFNVTGRNGIFRKRIHVCRIESLVVERDGASDIVLI